MNTIYASREDDYERPLTSDLCGDIRACRVMLSIVNYIMENYEVVSES